MDEGLLSKLYKPARYLGNEYGVVRKDWNAVYLKVALCFPDLYEVGMSHLGFRIIYQLLNGIEDVVCERVFAPACDLECIMRKDNIPLSSLESNTPLYEFDVIGFSLSYELLFPNVLNILQLSNIPLKADERSDRHPLIIGGGYACVNPEPIADFFDCFLIGEAEESILELIDAIRVRKLKGKDRKQLLRDLSRIEGLYVPCLYAVRYNQDGTVRLMPKDSFVPGKIKKRVVLNLDNAFFPTRWIVPYAQVVHDRVMLEIMRGCPNNCRFCQASSVYYPFRVRSQTKIIELAGLLLKYSGYEEISLLGLSCGDYPRIRQILTRLISLYEDRGISVSLPSLKAKNYIADIPLLLRKIKKRGLTFAPEAGSERLRRILNKNMDIKELFNVIESAYRAGYRHIKLYFMFGLPDEELDDLEKIVELAVNVVRLRKKVDGKLGNLTLSVSAFSPKPHTSFERFSMDVIEELKKKQAYLFSRFRCAIGAGRINPGFFKRGGIKIDFHSPEMSFIETVLSRSDRRVAQVIHNAFKLRVRFDSQRDKSRTFIEDSPQDNKKVQDKFNFAIWLKAFNDAGIDPYFYANRKIDPSEILPWSHIDIGRR